MDKGQLYKSFGNFARNLLNTEHDCNLIFGLLATDGGGIQWPAQLVDASKRVYADILYDEVRAERKKKFEFLQDIIESPDQFNAPSVFILVFNHIIDKEEKEFYKGSTNIVFKAI